MPYTTLHLILCTDFPLSLFRMYLRFIISTNTYLKRICTPNEGTYIFFLQWFFGIGIVWLHFFHACYGCCCSYLSICWALLLPIVPLKMFECSKKGIFLGGVRAHCTQSAAPNTWNRSANFSFFGLWKAIVLCNSTNMRGNETMLILSNYNLNIQFSLIWNNILFGTYNLSLFCFLVVQKKLFQVYEHNRITKKG